MKLIKLIYAVISSKNGKNMKKEYISESKNIPAGLYKKIVSLMPICCVDLVFWSEGKVHLFKRAYAPAKDKWWVAGGRILKGEKIKDAVARKAKEDIGVDVKIRKMIGVYDTFFGASRFDTKAKKHKNLNIFKMRRGSKGNECLGIH